MPAKIIDGKKIAEKIKDSIVQEIAKLPSRPNLAIILVGERPDSCLYVSLKEKESKKVGIDVHCYKFDNDASEKKLLECIEFLNKDAKIDGILVQLPLPKGFDTDKIIAAVDARKDVDGFHPMNLEKIKSGGNYVMPPLAGLVLEICREIEFDLHNEKIVIVGKSDVLLNGMSKILKQHGGEVATVKSDDSDLQKKCQQADVLITAVGKKHYLTSDFVKENAIVIDIGIIKEGKDTYGDVDFESVRKVAGYITPVPGGVGPMTIALAFRNVLELRRKAHP